MALEVGAAFRLALELAAHPGMRAGVRLGRIIEITASLGAGRWARSTRPAIVAWDETSRSRSSPRIRLDAPQARERFEREARSVAALQHPNICTIYDVGDADGHAFIVMELLHGETLQQRLRRGPIDLAASSTWPSHSPMACDAAHAAASFTATSSRPTSFSPTRGPKILDFGLAKPTFSLPRARSAVETARAADRGGHDASARSPYMSPEQLRGETCRRQIGPVLARAWSSTRWRPAGRRSRAPRVRRSAGRFFTRIRYRREVCARTCRRRSIRSCSRRWRRIAISAIRVPRTSAPICNARGVLPT